jgi:predicted Rossmann-fold nucleotide-binding protein
VNVGGYFESLFRFFDEAVDGGLIKPAHREMAQLASTVDEALAIATGPATSSPSKWTDPTVR